MVKKVKLDLVFFAANWQCCFRIKIFFLNLFNVVAKYLHNLTDITNIRILSRATQNWKTLSRLRYRLQFLNVIDKILICKPAIIWGSKIWFICHLEALMDFISWRLNFCVKIFIASLFFKYFKFSQNYFQTNDFECMSLG